MNAGGKVSGVSNGIVIAGAGSLGRVLFDFLTSCNIDVLAFIDDNPALAGSMVNGVRVRTVERVESEFPTEIPVVLAILDGQGRGDIGRRMLEKGYQFMEFRMESSFVSPFARIGKGCTLLPSSFVMNGATIGNCCHIHMFTVIGHDVIIGDFCAFAPHCTIGGGSSIGEGVTFGMGVNVVPNIEIGEYSIIGAGAVVTKNVPPRSVVFGTPSKIMRRRK